MGGSQYLDCTFVGNRRFMISINDAYHKLIDKHRWMEERVIKIQVFVSLLLGVSCDQCKLEFSIDVAS